MDLSLQQIEERLDRFAGRLAAYYSARRPFFDRDPMTIYGVPRGGAVVVLALAQRLRACDVNFILVDKPVNSASCFIIDDIEDSSSTRMRFEEQYPLANFIALVSKAERLQAGWISFPWEKSEPPVKDAVLRLLQSIPGENPSREGLCETPERFVRAWAHWVSGYTVDVRSILKTFDHAQSSGMVLVSGIPVYSLCEHHLAPFFGVAHIGYLPDGKVLGLSKFSRVVAALSRRLQIQERLTNEILSVIVDGLSPLGAGVVLRCRHLCVESRGVERQGTVFTTSSLAGNFMTKNKVREEFIRLALQQDQNYAAI